MISDVFVEQSSQGNGEEKRNDEEEKEGDYYSITNLAHNWRTEKLKKLKEKHNDKVIAYINVEYKRAGILILPMFVLSILVLIYVRVLDLQPQGSPPFNQFFPYQESEEDPIIIRILGSNLNALIMLSAVILLTILFVFLFYVKASGIVNYCVIFSFFFAFFGFTLYVGSYMFIDVASLVFISWNLSIGGIFFIFYSEEISQRFGLPLLLRNVYLLYVSAIASWPFACLSEMTCFFFLVQICLWDLFAVESRFGPLGFVMREQQRRIWLGEEEFKLPEGMLYKTDLYELGLGDFVFFGVIISRSIQINYAVFIACCCAMLASTIFTILLTMKLNRTIPALPLAVFMGVSVYFLCRYLLNDFLAYFNFEILFI